MNKNLKERIAAFYLAAIVTIIVIGSMIIFHEESSELKEFLNNLTGHHWVTKSVFAVILFPVLSGMFYVLFSSEKVRMTFKADTVLLWSILTVIITVFFICGSLLIYLVHFFR